VSVQYLALVYSRRLGEVEGTASVGSMGARSTMPWPKLPVASAGPGSSVDRGAGPAPSRLNWPLPDGWNGEGPSTWDFIPPAAFETAYYRQRVAVSEAA